MNHRSTAMLALLLVSLLTPCAVNAVPRVGGVAAARTDAQQLVVVITADWNANQGRLYRFVADAGRWRESAPSFAVTIGDNGSAWGEGLHPPQRDGVQKREGDHRSPAGVFAIGPAFGYAPQIDSGLRYQPMRLTSYCIDVPDSPLYNRIVDADQVGASAVAGSSEPMRRDLHKEGDPRYREGFVIEHNAAAVPGHGSCIFAHLWRGPGETTAGCTAMASADMRRLLAWLDAKAAPRFVLLPQAQYRRLQTAWALPTLETGR